MLEAPYRVCCGKRHHGARCPDGLVMCCACFERVTDDQLVRDEHDPSKRWDICLSCGERERVAIISWFMAAPRG